MSKIETEFKLKDLYAIKHALEDNIRTKLFTSCNNSDDVNKDILHEKQIVNYVVEVINKYKPTKQHYDEKDVNK